MSISDKLRFFKEINTSIDIKNLSITSIKEFLRLYIGMICFVKHNDLEEISQKKFSEAIKIESENDRIIKSYSLGLIHHTNSSKEYIVFDSAPILI